ncbi:MAG TPA: LysM peptidoglycan-binding domain-containing protein [Acidimicrobiales bacterium]|nr:LysM peptidoglycan-binding domain-containing protein [Acidimicrobiales bacterium]
MAALSFPSPLTRVEDRRSRGGAALQLVDGGRRRFPAGIDGDRPSEPGGSPVLALIPDPARVPRARHRPSAPVRLRRTLLAVSGLLVIGLALPLGGAGGHSHASGPALAGTTHPLAYTVQPGDTLWSIAVAVDPSADPRPLVATLASQTGSYTVEPGERISVP